MATEIPYITPTATAPHDSCLISTDHGAGAGGAGAGASRGASTGFLKPANSASRVILSDGNTGTGQSHVISGSTFCASGSQ